MESQSPHPLGIIHVSQVHHDQPLHKFFNSFPVYISKLVPFSGKNQGASPLSHRIQIFFVVDIPEVFFRLLHAGWIKCLDLCSSLLQAADYGNGGRFAHIVRVWLEG